VIAQTVARMTQLGASKIMDCVNVGLVVHHRHNFVLKVGFVGAQLTGHQDLHAGPAGGHQILRGEHSKVGSALVDASHAVQPVHADDALDVALGL